MNDEKLEFCSRGWVDYAREFVLGAAENADLEGVDVTFNEVFTDAPAHLEPDSDGRVGWYIRVRNGAVEVDRGILDEPDLRIVADYANTLPLARMVFADNPELAEEAQRLVEQATAEGKMRREGDGTAMASLPWAGRLHDVLAKRTA